jgi:hypothetical protein
MRGAFALRLSTAREVVGGQIAGSVKEVDTGREIRFRSEAPKMCGERRRACWKSSTTSLTSTRRIERVLRPALEVLPDGGAMEISGFSEPDAVLIQVPTRPGYRG